MKCWFLSFLSDLINGTPVKMPDYIISEKLEKKTISILYEELGLGDSFAHFISGNV